MIGRTDELFPMNSHHSMINYEGRRSYFLMNNTHTHTLVASPSMRAREISEMMSADMRVKSQS